MSNYHRLRYRKLTMKLRNAIPREPIQNAEGPTIVSCMLKYKTQFNLVY